jgi:mono/diheme cytochrome c family protein
VRYILRQSLPLVLLAGCAVSSQSAEDLPRREPIPAAAPASPGELASYTAAQAERGRSTFNNVCSVCHGLNEFRGRQFEIAWMARPVGDFLAHISTAMPQDNPGSLSAADYAAITAYVMQLNGLAAGDSEVPTDYRQLSGVRWRR